MLKLEIPKMSIENLQENLFKYSSKIENQKAIVLLLSIENIPSNKIAKALGISESTVRNYINGYIQDGDKSITTVNYYKPESILKKYEEELKILLNEKNPRNAAQAALIINEKLNEEKTQTIVQDSTVGIENSEFKITTRQAIRFMHSIGMKYRKTGTIPAKANIEEQQKFINEKLQPALVKAQENESKVYFLDASHFVLGSFPSYLWCSTKVLIKSSPGRQRYNVLGALDAITKQVITVTNEEYINGDVICEMLKKLKLHSDNKPITIVLDNAAYQKSKKVIETAKELNITLLFLTSYSPNLNIIERYWKYIKKEALNNKHYNTFGEFKDAIDLCVENGNDKKEEQEKLKTLLSLNFQTFGNENKYKIIS